ncbi:hypothetical protein ACIGNW_32365 [Streptomyces sp. NPDC053707]|uniref:hypothetical protein n=1 Tax=Streptomyces sp. NPDC053707 TaxID=3365712 RepID=UPI0037D18BF3
MALDPITVYSSQAADSFVSEWRATATNVSSKVQGPLSIPAQRLEVDLLEVLRPVLVNGGDDAEKEEGRDN